jgi:hypothetical protein
MAIIKYKNDLEDQLQNQYYKYNHLKTEILDSFDDSISGKDQEKISEDELYSSLGKPQEFIVNYLESRDIAEKIEPGEYNAIARISIKYQDIRRKPNYVKNFGIDDKIVLLPFLLPLIALISHIPKLFIGPNYAYSLLERWDDYFIIAIFLTYLPFLIELISGITGWQPISDYYYVKLRDIYRMGYIFTEIIFQLDIIIDYILHMSSTTFFFPMFLLYEIIIAIRDHALRPLNIELGIDISKKSIYYLLLILLVISRLILIFTFGI